MIDGILDGKKTNFGNKWGEARHVSLGDETCLQQLTDRCPLAGKLSVKDDVTEVRSGIVLGSEAPGVVGSASTRICKGSK